MNKFYKLLVFTLIACFSIVNTSYAVEASLKVATVNSNQILQQYPEAQKLLQDLATAEKTLNKKVITKRQELEKAKKQNKTETELQMLAEQMRLEIEPEAKKLEEQSAKRSLAIEDKVNKTIESVAKQGKYDFVLVQEAVLYGGTDITNDVLKQLK